MEFTLRRPKQSPILNARMSGKISSLFVQSEAVGLRGRILESKSMVLACPYTGTFVPSTSSTH